MSDTISCPACAAPLHRPAAMMAGIAIQCPGCQHVFTAPEADGAAPAGITSRPADAPPPRVATFDAGGIADRPLAHAEPTFGPDWRVDIGRWTNAAIDHWGKVLWPFAGYFLLAGAVLVPLFAGAAFLPLWALADFAPFGLMQGGGLNFELYRTCQLLDAVLVYPLIGLLAQLMLSGGVAVALRQLTGAPWTSNDFYAGFAKAGPLTGWWLVNQAFSLVAMGPLLYFQYVANQWIRPIAPGSPPYLFLAAGGYYFVGMCVYLYFAIRWSFTVCLIFDRGMTAFEAMATSWRMTRGHFWGLLGVYLYFGMVAFCGYIACGVGLLFVGSFLALAHAASYLEATAGQPRRRDRED